MLSPVKKTKREESSKAEAAKRQKVLDGRDVDKIKEDQHQLNTKKKSKVWTISVLKAWLEDLNFSSIHQLCSKECSVQRLCRRFGELYFSAEKHYEW